MSGDALLVPGQQIRPVIDEDRVVDLVHDLYGLTVESVTPLNAYDDKNYHILCSRDFENPNIESVESSGYVLKIVNSLDSQKLPVIEAQTELLLFLNARGIVCPLPVRNKSGDYFSPETFNDASKRHVVRLLVYRPGELLQKVPINEILLRKLGEFIVRLDLRLMGFSHPAYESHRTVWMLDAVPKLRDFTFVLKSDANRSLALEVISAFEAKVVGRLKDLEVGIIHGDLNEQNIVVVEDDEFVVIDFGDSQKSCLVFELAVALCYVMLQLRDPESPRYVLEGYQRSRRLTDLEKSILKVCVCARICQSLVLGAYTHLHDSKNDYVLSTQRNGWEILRRLWPVPEDVVLRLWQLVES